MNDAELFAAAHLFVAALHRRLHEADRGQKEDADRRLIIMCTRLFADAVDAESKRHNPWADRWPVYNTIDGRRCHDFSQGLAYMRQIGAISRPSHMPECATVIMSPREVQRVLNANPVEAPLALHLAETYLALEGQR